MTIAVVTVVVVTFFSKNNLTPPKPINFSGQLFAISRCFSFLFSFNNTIGIQVLNDLVSVKFDLMQTCYFGLH